MKELSLTKKVLLDIIDNEVPFSISLKNNFKYRFEDFDILDKEGRKLVSSLAGCTLRHYLSFKNYIVKNFNDISLENEISLMIYLTDSLITNKVNKDELKIFCNATLSKEEVEKAENIIYNNVTLKSLISEEEKRNTNIYFSLRYNTPVWIVKMWMKHFGTVNALNVLKSNAHAIKNSCLVNTSLISKNDLLNKYNEFIDSGFEDMVIYKGEIPLTKHEAYINKMVFGYSFAYKTMMDNVDVDPFRGIAIYSGYQNHLMLDLARRFTSNVAFDVVCENGQPYFDTKMQKEKYALKNVTCYECNAGGLITCISSKVHTLFVLPLSTNFQLLRTAPDYFLRIKQDSLDELIKNQKSALENANMCLENGGELVYAVPTLNKKETHNLVVDFLSEHEEYELVDEHQFFPFDDYDSTFYYAILRKNEVPND